jgi:V/A-type H+/Na+-transporting ATPase subunit D
MSSAKISPTRINLLAKKQELKVAERGHKLLKDKRDGLMREFMARVRDVRGLRTTVNDLMVDAFKSYVSASAIMPSQTITNAFSYDTPASTITVTERQVMSVGIPTFTVEVSKAKRHLPYGFLESYGNLDIAIKKFYEVYPSLVKLAELESTVERLALEIERTRRRASALENIRIPMLIETIRTITMRLEEQNRDAVVNTMRVKALITAKEKAKNIINANS